MNSHACAFGASVVVVAAFAFGQDAVQWRVEDGGNGHWYARRTLSGGDQSHDRARVLAQAEGGELATVLSEAENTLLRNLNGNQFRSYWLGGVQIDPACGGTGCDWQWVTGEAWQYENWCCGGDNDVGGNENCLASSENGQWNSVSCRGGLGLEHYMVEWSADCNGDGVVDFGQIRAGQLADANSDNIPDVCQCPTPHVVRVPQDAPSIAAAVDLACPGVPMEVVVAPGTWIMQAAVPTSYYAPIVVRGAGGGETIITDAADEVPLLDILDGGAFVDCRMKDLTVANVFGSRNPMAFENCVVRDCVSTFLAAEGATTGTRFERCRPWSNSAVLYTGFEVVDCAFIDCTEPILWWAEQPRTVRGLDFTNTTGHSIRIYAGCCAGTTNHYTITDCTFSGTIGNAVKLEYTPHPDAPRVLTDFINCTFTDNIAPAGAAGGGAVRVGIAELTTPLNSLDTLTTFTACTFTGNLAPNGGAIYMARNHPVVLTNCTFAGNTATAGDGGAIAEQAEGSGVSLAASGCTFVGNQALTLGGRGGAIAALGWFGALELDTCTFRQNAADSGGAVACDRSRFVVQNCLFEDNDSSVDGGAATVSSTLPSSQVRNTTFRGNSAMRHGGALELPFFVTVPFEDCVFEMNTAIQHGGAVRVWYEPASSFLRCQFRSNAAASGTSIFTFNYGTPLSVTLDACAISNESPSSSQGRVIVSDAAGVTVANSVICGSGTTPFAPTIADTGGNCIVETCTDLDGSGIPDGCEAYRVPEDYATIQAAIDAVPAGESRVIQVAAGTYNESFSLNGKDVVVRGTPGGGTILDGTGLTTAIARFAGEPATAGVQDLVFRNGTAGSRIFPKATYVVGGAIYANQSSAFIRRCEFRQNRSNFGGAAYLYKCRTLVEDSLFTGNIADDEGGAVLAFESTVTARGTAFVSNQCGTVNPGSGSGFKSVGARVAGETSLLENCSFTGGIAGVDGAAVEHFENTVAVPGSIRIVNTQITGNSTGIRAGGLRVIGRMASCVLASGTIICGNANRNVDGPFLIEGSVTVCDCLADVARDGSVNGGDLGIVLNAWGLANSEGMGDVSHDGTVNGEDLSLVLSAWGACP